MSVHVEILKEATDEVTKAFERLIPQLSTSAVVPGREAIQEIIASDAITMLVARLDQRIVGALTLAIFPIPTGIRAWIEDVIVDEAARGRGIGEALSVEALALARRAGARTVDLTSRPSREAAGRLYERIGFQLRESRLYRYTLA